MLYTWQFILFSIYSILLVILYIFVIVILIGSKDFKAPFFRLAIVLGFVDICTHYSIWFQMKLPWSPITGPWIYTYPIPWFFIYNNFNTYFLPQAREVLILASAFNRFTALAMPHRQKEFWSKFLWPIVILAFIIPLPWTFQILFGNITVTHFYLDETIPSFVIIVKNRWFESQFGRITVYNCIYTLITCSLTFICNVFTVYQLYLRNQLRKQQSGLISNVTNKTEVNLLKISLWDFSLGLIFTLHQLAMWLMPDPFDPWYDRIYLLTPWIFDAVTLSRPLILIYMCQQMQVAIMLAIGGKKIIPNFTVGGGNTVTILSTQATGRSK